MYPVSELYKSKIKENNRIFKCQITINHSQGTLTLTDKDLVLGSLLYSEGSQAGEEFTIGGTVASDLSFSIMNKPEYDSINFMGARVTVTISLLIREGADAHFLQPSQPSKMLNSGDLWEDVPLGRFNIDSVKRLRNTIELKAIDDMANLDIPYSLSKLSYPATLYQIYVNICNVADVQVGTVNFPNKDYVVTNRPDGDLTLRDVLGYVAELSGTFAKFNRTGALELKWYTSTNIEIGPQNRFNFKPSDDEVRIKGIMATVGDTTFLAGTDEYAIDLTENPLLQSSHETVLPNIFNNVKDTVFTPYTSDWQGNMAVQAGDMIKQIDIDGKEYNTLVTKSVYKYRGKSILEAKGLPDISKGFKGSTDKRIAQIKKVIVEEVGDKLTTLEQAQLNAMELMSNMLGGHLIVDKPNGIFYIADHPDINQAKNIWKYGVGGYAHYPDGLNSVPDTAVTADGSIVAMLVAANIISANYVQTGILSSEDGNSFFDLDNGILRISHGGNTYSQGDINGWGKDYGNGIVSYLNGIDVVTRNVGAMPPSSSPIPNLVLNLPLKFKGRNDVKIIPFLTTFNFNPVTPYWAIDGMLYTDLEIVSYNSDPNPNNPLTPPTVTVFAQMEVEWLRQSNMQYESEYYPISFNLLVVGE